MSPIPIHSRSRGALAARALAALLLLAVAPAAGAATYMWNNPAGGLWSDAANWAPNGVPGAGDVASLGVLDAPYTITLDTDPAVAEIDLASGPTLDLAGHSLAGVGQVNNAGRLLGLSGDYDGARYHNLAGGWIAAQDHATLTVHGPIDNAGTIAVGPSPDAVLWLASSTTFQGTGTLLLTGHARVDCPLARPQMTILLGNAAGHTLSGAGDVFVPITNAGLLLQDHSQGDLLTIHQYLGNSGTVRVSNGGAINVDHPLVKSEGGSIVGSDGSFTIMMPFDVGGTLSNLYGGSLVADGGDLRIGMGTLAEGVVQRSGDTGAVAITTVATPQNVVVAAGAELRVDGAVDLTAAGSSLVNHGTVRVRGTLNFDARPGYEDITLGGDGTLFLDGGTLATPAGGTMINAAGHTIAGCGTIAANIDNQGTIALDCDSGIHPGTLGAGRIVNHQLMAVNRGIVYLSGNTLVNQGRFLARGGDLKFQNGSVLDNRAGLFVNEQANVWFGVRGAAATVVGGTLYAAGTGEYRTVGPVTLQDVTLGTGATFRALQNGAVLASGASFTNLGTTRVEAGGAFTLGSTTAFAPAAGTTILAGGTLTVPLGLVVQGALRGTGTVVGDVTNAGLVAPDASALGLRVQGAYAQTTAGRLEVGIGGVTPDLVGHLDVTGAASLAGAVSVFRAGGFVPPAGADLPIMTFASHAGTFAAVAPDPGLDVAPVYGDAALTLHTGSLVGVGDPPAATPRTVSLYTRGSAFVLELPAAATVHLRVYDAAGRSVTALLDGASPAGTRTFDLRDLDRGLARGIYFARATVESAGGTTIRRARLAYLR